MPCRLRRSGATVELLWQRLLHGPTSPWPHPWLDPQLPDWLVSHCREFPQRFALPFRPTSKHGTGLTIFLAFRSGFVPIDLNAEKDILDDPLNDTELLKRARYLFEALDISNITNALFQGSEVLFESVG